MAFATKYRLEFDTIRLNKVKIDIQEDAFGGSITNLSGVGYKLTRPDGDLDKLTGIRTSGLTFSVLADGTVNPENFFTTSDIQYKVLLYFNDVLNWAGWLDSAAYSFPYRDENYLIDINAKDGLHLLQKKDLTTAFSTSEIFGNISVFGYIATCLTNTQLELNINTWIDIYPDGFPVRGDGGDTLGENDPLRNIYIDSGTFRTGVNQYETCFVVLNKICESFKATFFQARGEWHFVYVEDWIRNLGLTGSKTNYLGIAQSYSSNVFTQVEVGLNKTHKLANDNARVSLTPINSDVKTEFAYDVPPAKIKNEDISIIDESTVTSFLGVNTNYKAYDLEDYSVVSLSGQSVYAFERDFSPSDPNDADKRWIQFINDVDATPSNDDVAVTCTDIIVNGGDSFSISFETGNLNSVGSTPTTAVTLLEIHIKVTDGVTDRWLKADGYWSTTFAKAGFPLSGTDSNTYTLSEPKNVSYYNIQPIPISGFLQITFYYKEPNDNAITLNTLTTFIRNIEFQYKASVGYSQRRDVSGGFREIPGGQFYLSSDDITTKNKERSEIFLCNSPNRAVQGAIMDEDGVLIKEWVHNGLSDEMPFGKLINRVVYKCLYRNYYKIESNLLNIANGNYIISNLDNLIIDGLTNKIFMITTIDVDIRNEQAEFTCVELVDETNSDDFDAVATTERTQYTSDVGGRLSAGVKEKKFRSPADYQLGPIGFIFATIQRRG